MKTKKGGLQSALNTAMNNLISVREREMWRVENYAQFSVCGVYFIYLKRL